MFASPCGSTLSSYLTVREHAFELPNNVSINLPFDEVRRSVVELQEAHKELFSVNAVLEPGIGL